MAAQKNLLLARLVRPTRKLAMALKPFFTQRELDSIRDANLRAQVPAASSSSQWSKSLRNYRPLTPQPKRFGETQTTIMPHQARDQQLMQWEPRGSLSAASRTAVGKQRTIHWGGNEQGNLAYYPLPLGRHLFSTR